MAELDLKYQAPSGGGLLQVFALDLQRIATGEGQEMYIVR